jgi:prophage regulatory protein
MEPLGTRRAPLEPGDEILRQSEVLQITKLSRTTIWRLRKQRRFPEPLDISVGVKGWLRSDIERWMRGLSRG